MFKMILRSLLGVIPVLWVVMTVSFVIIRLAPGNPFSQEQRLPEVVRLNLEKKYGLDKPIFIQYLNYLKAILGGDLGESTAYPDYGVATYLWRGFKTSLMIGLMAFGFSVALGLSTGILAALYHNRWLDYLLMVLALVGISLPVFVFAPLLIDLFAIRLKWLPTSGWISEGWKRAILPLIAMVSGSFGTLARLTRTSTLNIMSSDYVRTARAKGLSEARVVLVHMMPGILTPLVTYLSPVLAGVLTGSFVIERIFRIPGMGTYFTQSALNRDYFLLLGAVVFYSVLLITMNTVADILYRVIDLRVTYETKK